MDRPTGVVSVLREKRYWWDRVCNTAQMDGVGSVHDPNGCQRSTVSALGDYTEPRLGEERGRPLGTAWVCSDNSSSIP